MTARWPCIGVALLLTLLPGGCATTSPQSAAERAYGTYWGYGVASPASGLRLVWVTPSQTACEVVRRLDQSRTPGEWRASALLLELVGGDGTNVEFDARCQVMGLVPGSAAMAVSSPPHQMALAYEQVGYVIAPSTETCARLHYVIPPCFPVTLHAGAASGQ